MSARGWALFALVSVLWGVPYLFNDIALRELGPLTIAGSRVLIASLILGPLLLVRGRWRVFTTHPIKLVVLALVEVVIPFSLIAIGQQTVPSGTTGVLIALEPLFIALLAPLVLRSPGLRPIGWVGLAIGLAGVTTLLGLDVTGPGALYIAAAALSYGVGAILMDKWFTGVDSFAVTGGMILTATPVLIAIALLTEPVTIPSAGVVGALVALGIACTAGGFAAFFALIRNAGPTKAAFITYAAPIVALIAGVTILNEHVTLMQLLGCALILAGAALVMRRQPQTTTPPGSIPAG